MNSSFFTIGKWKNTFKINEKSNKRQFVNLYSFQSGDIVSGFGMRPGVTQALWPKNLQLSDFPVGA
ncbi:MAG: hypothetical protein ACXAB2_13830, partial [Candidatus Hodarchaeales archaeon]